MATYLPYIQIVLSVLLVGSVLLQRSESGLGAGFGSDSGGGYHSVRRGFEKLLFNATILIAILFVLATFAPLFVR